MNELSIGDIQAKMAAGELTARSLTAFYLERIAQIDRSGPQLNSVVEVNPDALEIAVGLDEERAARRPRGPLHGVPILLKDNIATGDRMQTTAGSLALAGVRAPADAFITRQLRTAGAVILGKTNLSEWANFRSFRATSGWSSRGGQTRNPYALDRNPGGSSSGSAVAVTANLCAAAVGTETDGSIIRPAQLNGIAGLKPTVGLTSRRGIIPVAHSQDTAGPMGRTVRDVAILLGGMTGVDAQDASTAESEAYAGLDYEQFLDADGLRGARIGVARNLFGFHDQMEQIVEGALVTMQGLGATIVDPADVEHVAELEAPEYEVMLYEFKSDLDAYLAQLGPQAPVHSLADLITFNREHAAQVMPYFAQEHFENAAEKGPLAEDAYREALATCRRLAREEGIDATLGEHNLDAIVAPAGGPAWLTDWLKGDHVKSSCPRPAAVAGYPHVTVPAGFLFGLPVAISFFAGAYQEPVLLRLAYAFEQATKARRPPRFRRTVDFGVATGE